MNLNIIKEYMINYCIGCKMPNGKILTNYKHCCNCKMNYSDYQEMHCCTCNKNWYWDHCCKCNMSIPKDKTHHCCGCKMNYCNEHIMKINNLN